MTGESSSLSFCDKDFHHTLELRVSMLFIETTQAKAAKVS